MGKVGAGAFVLTNLKALTTGNVALLETLIELLIICVRARARVGGVGGRVRGRVLASYYACRCKRTSVRMAACAELRLPV